MRSYGAGTAAGSQEPTFALEPAREYTDGDGAAALASAYAFDLDPWQRRVVDCWLGRAASGALTALTCGLSCPRQNGKNGAIEALELFLLLNAPGTHILHTAHQVRTSKRAFNRLAGIFEDRRHPELQAELASVRRTNGEEMITLAGGNTIEYASRSRGGGRGFDAISLVVYDEAQELTDEQVEALMSTLAASPTGDRQVLYAGTPPGPGAPGDVFRRVREAAMGPDAPAGAAWHEWGVDSEACPVPDGAAFADVLGMVRRANPAMGTRLSEEFAAQEFAAMTPAGFARERLGWWNPAAAGFEPAVDPALWEAAAVGPEDAPRDGRRAIGVKFAPEGDRAAVSGCVMPEGGDPYVELVADVAMPSGLAALADWLADPARMARTAEVAVDGRAHSGALAAELAARGVKPAAVRMMAPGEVCAAASMMLSRLSGGTLRRAAGDGDALTASVLGCARRPVGSSGAWALGDGPARSYMAEAASIALYACETTRRRPGRRMVVW